MAFNARATEKLNPSLPTEATQQSARLPKPVSSASSKCQDCRSALLAACWKSAFPRGLAQHAADNVKVWLWAHGIFCKPQDRDRLQGKKGQGPSDKAHFKKLQVEMSLSLTLPSPQKTRSGSKLAHH